MPSSAPTSMCWSRVSGWIQDAVQLIFKGQPLKIWKDMQKRVVNNPMPFLNFNEENLTNTVRLSFSWIRIYSSTINDSTDFAWNRSSMLTFKIDNFLKKTCYDFWTFQSITANCNLMEKIMHPQIWHPLFWEKCQIIISPVKSQSAFTRFSHLTWVLIALQICQNI